MRQQDFEQRHREAWQALHHLLDELERPRFRRRLSSSEQARLPELYRDLCNHYALARSRRYSPALIAELHDLVTRSHRRFYQIHNNGNPWNLLHFFIADFPATLRRHHGYFWLALALFLIPALALGVLSYHNPEMIYSIMEDGNVAEIEAMYNPQQRDDRSIHRGSESNFMMFGFYIKNNISIGFRTFAGGILLGLGTLFFLIYNGLVIGGVAGHLSQLGYHDTFWTFVAGHGSFELTAIVICGAAGLLLGHAILAPGRYRRSEALKRRARIALKLVIGAAILLTIAAFIEAFWSSLQLPPTIKYSVAALLWITVIAHLTLGGRSR